MYKIICILIVSLASVSHADTDSNRLQGVFYQTEIPFVSRSESSRIMHNFRGQDGTIETVLRNTQGRVSLRQARILGFQFCREQGFHSIGAVFWAGNRLTGVHCINEDTTHREVLRHSFGVGCQVLRYTSPSCARAIHGARVIQGTRDLEFESVDVRPNADQPNTNHTDSVGGSVH